MQFVAAQRHGHEKVITLLTLIVFHNLLRTCFQPEHCGAKNPGLIMSYIAATLNPEILKNFPGPVRVGKKKSGSGRVAGTRQGLLIVCRAGNITVTFFCVLSCLVSLGLLCLIGLIGLLGLLGLMGLMGLLGKKRPMKPMRPMRPKRPMRPMRPNTTN